MNPAAQPVRLSPVIRAKLVSIRCRALAIGTAEAAMAGATVLAAGMLIAIGIDWGLTVRQHGWRLAMTGTVLLASCALLAFLFVRVMRGHWVLSAVAMRVDRAFPFLQERWSAVTELTSSSDPPQILGSQRMLWQTMLEAENYAHLISPSAVISSGALRRRQRVLAVLLGMVVLLVVAAPEPMRILVRRFWNPLTDITLTRVQAVTGTRVVPRGEPLTLTAKLEGRVNVETQLAIRRLGITESIKLTPSNESPTTFAHVIPSVREPFEYRFRAGDGQTDWYRITPADRPALESVSFRVTPPEYSRLPTEQRDALPRYYRALEGSRLEIVLRTNKPMVAMQLDRPDDRPASLAATGPQSFRYDAVLTENLTFTPRLIDANGLTSAPLPACRIVVAQDTAPSVQVVSPDDELVVRPDEKVAIRFDANDDLGVKSAELLVTVDPQEPSAQSRPATQSAFASDEQPPGPRTTAIPIPLGPQQDAKTVHGEVELDVGQFKLNPGEQLRYSIRVSDARSSKASMAGSAQRAVQSDEAPEETKQATGGVEAKGEETSQSRPEEANRASKKRETGRDGIDDHAPPDSGMIRRLFDVTGTARSGTQRIRVDEWAGSYSGQARRKKQISIEAFLKRLDAALTNAQGLTEGLLRQIREGARWDGASAARLGEARGHLGDADVAVTELKRESANTPYAMMGLQLDDIAVAHVSPARRKLSDADAVGETERTVLLDQGAYHIARARELLAALTREYEAVKQQELRAEAVETLAKLHRLFIEDMQRLLGACMPTLNPREGKWRLVPDELAEAVLKRIRESLERKKAMLDALAKILAEDPDLLRRYMALTRKEARTLRDQLTVLAERQREQQVLLGKWADGGAEARRKLIEAQADRLLAEQTELAQRAAQLHDNVVTWAPREVSRDTGPLAECIRQADQLARVARNVPPLMANGQMDAAVKAIEEQVIPMVENLANRLAEVGTQGTATPPMLRCIARRLDETSALQSRQEDWLAKVRAVRAGRADRLINIEQRQLTPPTRNLGDRMSSMAGCLGGSCSRPIGELARNLGTSLEDEIPRYQAAVGGALDKEDMVNARSSQERAVLAFERTEKLFDVLLTQVEEAVANMPVSMPSGDTPPTLSLAEQLARLTSSLQEEADACQKLGAVIHSNISIEGDWGDPGQTGSGGQAGDTEGSGNERGSRSERSQQKGSAERTEFEKASARARAAAEEAEHDLAAAGASAKRKREAKSPGGEGDGRASRTGGTAAETRDWNVLISKLESALRQGHEALPPEQYRAAIDAYFRNVGGVTAGKSVTTGTAD